MICPHCNTGTNVEWDSEPYTKGDPNKAGFGFEVICCVCPVCELPIVKMQRGRGRKHTDESSSYSWFDMHEVLTEEILFPKSLTRKIEVEVPDVYRGEYQEAFMVLTVSPKASAALSRRILQNILREEYGIKKRSLAAEIDEFIQKSNVPSYLTEAIDAVRNIGNFAAHPLKNTETGEIVGVEPGDAEWLLEVLDSLFDFTFVQPKRLQNRKQKLNQKLQAMGKPDMKS